MRLVAFLEQIAQSGRVPPEPPTRVPDPDEDDLRPDVLAYSIGLFRVMWGSAGTLAFLSSHKAAWDVAQRTDVLTLSGRLAFESGNFGAAADYFEDALYRATSEERAVALANLAVLSSSYGTAHDATKWRDYRRREQTHASSVRADVESANEYWRSVVRGSSHEAPRLADISERGLDISRDASEVSFAAHYLKFTISHMRFSAAADVGDPGSMWNSLQEMELVALSATSILADAPPVTEWMSITLALAEARYAIAVRDSRLLEDSIHRVGTLSDVPGGRRSAAGQALLAANLALLQLELARISRLDTSGAVAEVQRSAHELQEVLRDDDPRAAIAKANAALVAADASRASGRSADALDILRSAEIQLVEAVGDHSDGLELIRRELHLIDDQPIESLGSTVTRRRVRLAQGDDGDGDYVNWSIVTASTRVLRTGTGAATDIGSAEDFLAAVEKTLKFFNDGDLIKGTVVRIARDEIWVDVGYATEGVIPSRELSIKHDVDPNEVVKIGDEVEALVLQKEDKEGRLILSKKRAQYLRAWDDVEKIKENDGVVTGSVIEVVKGGLIVDIGLRGFLPASLIELRRVGDLTPYLGQEIEAKILELDKNRNNVVLSRRALLEQTQSESRTTLLNNLHKGQVRKGTVSSIVNFGAFVDLGGVDGLVHLSELSWKHIEHASEVVEVGQEVTVEILEVDLDRERVSLSLKATQEDPWQVFARTHAIGQIAPAKVTKLVPFGAFVRVTDGIEGLVHISELSGKHVELAEQVVSVGEEIFVKIIDLDLERRRISLSLKQANESVDPFGTEFDPALYGMVTEYDEHGEYKYPEGFDPETNAWLEGFDEQREKWEQEYAAAHARWEAHKAAVTNALGRKSSGGSHEHPAELSGDVPEARDEYSEWFE